MSSTCVEGVRRRNRVDDPVTTVTDDANTAAFRLSLQQRSLWTLRQAAGADPFQAVCAVEIQGNLQADLLQQALQQVVERHEILRTSFQRPPGIKTPFQVVSPLAAYGWQTVDISGLSDAGERQTIDEWVARQVEHTADLERGPVLQATLIRQPGAHHVLLLSLPALCGDARTLANLTRELGEAYASRLNGQALSGEPLQYADFAQWQQELLEGSGGNAEQAASGKAYWTAVARTAAPAPGLPLRRRAQATQPFEEGRAVVGLDAVLSSRVEAAARAHGTTASTVLFACWQAVLWRLDGQPESAFTIQRFCDGRQVEDLQPALGLYGKYLPMRCRCRDERFADHLRDVIDACASADEWQEYADLEPCLDAAVSFDFEERPAPFASGGIAFSPVAQYVRLHPVTLTLSCVRSGDALSADLLYNRHELDDAVVARYAGYFERFLAAVVEDADRTLGDIDILSEQERVHLLFEINETATEFSRHACIHQLFEEQVERTPDALAVVAAPHELTYRELNARANQLAHVLRRHGVKPNVRVGLCIGRSAEMIVGLLGILKAGGAYVPLNPEHPAARLVLQLAESQAAVLVTSDPAAAPLPGFAGGTIDLSRERALLEAQPGVNPPAIADSENLVYVIYTSGSTGTPKGVGVPHRSLVNYAQFMVGRLQSDRPLHFATVSTITADLGNTCIFPALVSGGCLHVLGYDVAMEPRRFQEYVATRPIDVLKIVPSHLSTLLVSQSYKSILPSKYLILGGEALRWELVATVARISDKCKVINHYGPTEATVGCLTFAVDPPATAAASLTVPLGRPIANARAYILDPRFRPVPTGVTGELYIGGEGVAAGYLNDAAETAARFLPDPFVSDPAARVYRTGDQARYLAEGTIEFVGRADHQVKVRGFRVEPGEIEAVLTAASGVRQAVVVVWGEASGDQRLVAYVTPATGAPLSQDALRASAKEKLPDYMVPSSFVVLPTMPLTPNGKVDRAALPAPDESRPDLQRTFVAPRTPVERELANIWGSLLNLSNVGVHDNFFELGGHSLLATRVVSRLRQVFELEIPLGSLFESPTVAALAQEIERATGGRKSDILIDVAELEQLSDEEAARLLGLEGGPKPLTR